MAVYMAHALHIWLYSHNSIDFACRSNSTERVYNNYIIIKKYSSHQISALSLCEKALIRCGDLITHFNILIFS